MLHIGKRHRLDGNSRNDQSLGGNWSICMCLLPNLHTNFISHIPTWKVTPAQPAGPSVWVQCYARAWEPWSSPPRGSSFTRPSTAPTWTTTWLWWSCPCRPPGPTPSSPSVSPRRSTTSWRTQSATSLAGVPWEKEVRRLCGHTDIAVVVCSEMQGCKDTVWGHMCRN